MEKNCCCTKTKKRSEKEYKSLVNRLSRIEGQIRGIRTMVENAKVGRRYTGLKLRLQDKV